MAGENRDGREAIRRGLLIVAGLAALAVLTSCAPVVEQGAAEPASADFGPRIPTKFFRTGGTGTSWEGIPPDPYETFSYDGALLAAGIEDFNVVPYTSVLPKECYGNEMTIDSVKPYFHPGSVLEVIMAKIDGQVSVGQRKTLVTGVGIVWAAEPSTPNVLRNGYAAEYEYSSFPVADEEARQAAIAQLNKSLDHELKIRGLVELTGSERQYQIDVLQLVYAPEKVKYGYSLSALGFVEFDFPLPYPLGSGGESPNP